MELELSLCELRLEASLSNTRVLLRQAGEKLSECYSMLLAPCWLPQSALTRLSKRVSAMAAPKPQVMDVWLGIRVREVVNHSLCCHETIGTWPF